MLRTHSRLFDIHSVECRSHGLRGNLPAAYVVVVVVSLEGKFHAAFVAYALAQARLICGVFRRHIRHPDAAADGIQSLDRRKTDSPGLS